MKTPEKLYRCSRCGFILTEEEWLDEIGFGGSGYCMCEYSAIDEEGNVWYPRILHEYRVYRLQGSASKARKQDE